jgi:hypothetical protein
MSRLRHPNRHREKQAPRAMQDEAFLRASQAKGLNITHGRIAPLVDSANITKGTGYGAQTRTRCDWDNMGWPYS